MRKEQHRILDAMADAVVLTNEHGIIVFVNSKFEDLFGYKPEEVIGKEVEILMPARYRERHQTQRHDFQENQRVRFMGNGLELKALKNGGVEIDVEIALSPFVDGDGKRLIVSSIRDISERKALAKNLQEQANVGKLSSAFASNLVSGKSLEDTLVNCVESIVEHLSLLSAGIWLIHKSLAEPVLEIFCQSDKAAITVLQKEERKHVLNLIKNLADKGNPYEIPDVDETNEEVRRDTYLFQIDETLIGVLITYSSQPLPILYTQSLELLSQHISLAVDIKIRESTTQFLASVIEFSAEAIISRNCDGIIQSWNPAAERLLGYTANEAIGQHLSLILPESKMSELDYFNEHLSAGKTIPYFDTLRRCKSGMIIEVSVCVLPFKDRVGNWAGSAAIIRDTSERKLLEQSRSQLRQLVEREEFMYTLSHDLKNPLIGANRVIEQLVRGEFGIISSDACSILNKLSDCNQSLVSMIQDLISVYRLEKSSNIDDFVETKLDELIQQSYEDLQLLVTAHRKTLTLEITNSQNSYLILANKNAILRVLQNLLDNAAKFGSKNTEVTIRLSTEMDNVLLEVVNYGSYLTAEEISSLFQRFWQGPSGRSYQSGSGLGLYLCNQIVSAHGGNISCRSNLETNSTVFSVRLPQAAKAGVS